MAKPPEKTQGTPTPAADSRPGAMTFFVDPPEQTYVQCIVCGHKNPIDVGLCEMCSNYLFDKKKK